MKLRSTTLERPAGRQLIRMIGYGTAGFLSAALCLEGRAPLAAGLLSAVARGLPALSVLLGAAVGSFTLLDFGPAFRCCGTLILIVTILAAFQDTVWIKHPLFRPLTAAGTTLAVELAYAIQVGLTPAALTRLGAATVLSGLLSHYCSLLLGEASLGRRQPSRERDSLRERLKLSAQALRSLYESISPPPEQKEENPSVVFDRAAELVCRGCTLRERCWSQNYIDTYGAFNDATPAMLRRGRAEPEDFPSHFTDRCVHFPQLLSAINTEVRSLLLRRQYRQQLQQERQRTKGQYAQMSELVAAAMAGPEAGVRSKASLRYDVALGGDPKAGQKVSGDSLTYFKTGGHLYLLLSDGMGTGEEARRESQLTLRLTEQFLTAGIEAEAALKTLNAALALRGDERGSFTTIDLLELNLSSGETALYKYGAAPTYIKRQGSVRRLTGTALPAGLQEAGTAPSLLTFSLEEDSFVLMISDGVADSGDDKWVQDLLAGWQGTDPNELTSLVLRECRKRRGGSDDASALCLYLPPRSGGNGGKRAV